MKIIPIDAKVQERLDRAIREMLAARMTTGQIRDLLCKEQSFGKYDGCTPAAILERANGICHDVNAQLRKEWRSFQAQAFRDCPSLREFARRPL